jgi:dimethylargininase
MTSLENKDRVGLPMDPKRAIVREPGTQLGRCISSHPEWHTLNVALAHQQHKDYCNTLAELGLEVIQLPRDNQHPDSCFVEDTAIIHNDRALIARFAPESRRGEISAVEELLQEFSIRTTKAVSPATIEGGDVIQLQEKLLCGVTKRTNMEGATQLASWLSIKVETHVDPFIVHLKSHATHIGSNRMIATKAFANDLALKGFTVIAVPADENCAANSLAIGNTVLMPSGCPLTQSMVRGAGYDVVPLNISEFQKCDGGLTCLSILL